MTQTLAIFLDAYRELNARKMFWITLIITGVFVSGFALVSVRADGLYFVGIHFAEPAMPGMAYRSIFNWVIIWFWLSICATVLALISTAAIFHEFISGGSIDLYLSKPLGRPRLFLIKYLSGLLFVFLQIGVAIVLSFFIMGIRGGQWIPGLFWAIPLVVCFFSYLFAICVLLGQITRSTITALLLTILIWGGFFGLHKADSLSYRAQTLFERQAVRAHRDAADAQAALAELQAKPPESQTLADARRLYHQRRLDRATDIIAAAEPAAKKMRMIHKTSVALITTLPKTSETTDLLERTLFSDKELAERNAAENANTEAALSGNEQANDVLAWEEAGQASERAMRARSPLWIIGTSLAFEAGVLALAMWIFCRRDY